jgi:hypothetical protein
LKERLRHQKRNARRKKQRRDPISYFLVPLPESAEADLIVKHKAVLAELVEKLEIKKSIDQLTPKEWRELIGLVIARVVIKK